MTTDPYNEYQFPEIYDAEYGQWTGDFEIFLGENKSGRALDLACGTGRLAIAMARAGLSCIGLDGSPEMLELAMKKSAGLDISYILGEMTEFDLGEQFDLITLSGNSFQALLTDEDHLKMLTCVKRHLKDNGVFIFDTRNALPSELRTTDAFEYWHEFTDHNRVLVNVYGMQIYDPSKQTVTYTTKRVWADHEVLTEITLKYTRFDEISACLEKAGLTLIKAYGNYDKSLLSNNSPSIIFVCQPSAENPKPYRS